MKTDIYVVLRVLDNRVVEVYDIFDTRHQADIMVEGENEKGEPGVVQAVNINA